MSQAEQNQGNKRFCQGCNDNRLGQKLKRAYRMVFRSAEKVSPCQLPENRLTYCRQLMKSTPKRRETEYIQCEQFLEKVNKLQKFKETMQPKFQNLTNCHSTKLLQKCTSLPAFSQSTNSSTHSIDSIDEEYRKHAIKWILSFHKKVTKDTQYIAIALFNKLTPPGLQINEENHQKIALSCLLIASKMNEIYPPKISQMIAKCKKFIHKDEILDIEGSILSSLGFDVAIDSTIFTQMHKILGCIYAEKLQQCEKLYRMVACHRQLYQFGDEIAAYAIIYLIIPDFIRKMKLRQNHKIKTLAIKIYNIYTEAKESYEREKENRNRMP